MKKNKTLIILAFSSALALSACGGGNTENVQTQSAAQTESSAAGPEADAIQQTRPEAAVPLPDEFEPAFFEGTVTGHEGNILTVEKDGKTMSFDISRNTEDAENPIIRGCYVEVSYADAAENNIYPSDVVSILNDNEQLAEAEGRDPVIFGKLQFMDVNEIEITDDAGRTIEFDGAIARKVSFSDLLKGDDVAVTYCGSIVSGEDSEGVFGGTPYALKVVSADAVKTEDAMENYIEGTVSAVSGGSMTLSNAINDFDCTGDEAVFSGIKEEDRVRIYYTGSLSDIVIKVVKAELL